MKFKTFRLLIVAAGLMLCAGGGLALMSFMNSSTTDDVDATWVDPQVHELPTGSGGGSATGSDVGTVVEHRADPTAPPPEPRTAAAPDGLRDLDRRILDLVGRGIGGSKVKDAFPGETWKVNVYQDSGFAKPNRLKLDLDRDDNWDEKWTFDGDEVKRQVSPDDDGSSYPDEYRLAGDRWESWSAPQVGGAIDTPPPAPAAGTEPLRNLDRLILAKIGAGIGGSKAKDAFSGQPWKANLYRDAGESGVNRVKLDLDRDEKWDEKWTIEREGGQETVKRQVAPNDDESYTEEYRLRGGAWAVKQP